MPGTADSSYPSERTTNLVVQWVKLLLPIAIGAIGLYVGQIIAPMESKLTKLSEDTEAFKVHVISDTEIMNALSDRIDHIENDLNSHKASDHATYAKKEAFLDFRSECRAAVKDMRSRQYKLPTYNNSNGNHLK